MRRYNDAGARTNDFTYSYQTNKNKLTNVSGHVSTYTYNTIGQMTGEDKVEGNDQYVEYDVTGKVRKVFSDAQKQNLKVEFLYDDRGFRLAKKNLETNKTTWYIRDASGNILSVYEEDSQGLMQTELPLYGSGKLGTYYPQQDGASAYEITDHLGNVRALVRDNVTEYTATMEDNGQEALSNPRVQEMQYFQNLFKTERADIYMNHSLPVVGVEESPDKSAYLFWQSGVADMDAEDRSVGPGIMLKVNAGDKIDMESWVRYEKRASYSRDLDILLLAQFLGNSFATTAGFEGATQATNTFQNALQLAGFAGDDDNDTRPFAYLNYILFNNDMTLTDAGWQRIPEDAGFDAGQESLPGMHRQVSFETPVKVNESGYIYVWVSNESENTKVWFDDLKVTHAGSFITQATDYGVWGDVLREQKTGESVYRFGYQGQYAEKDEETGWNHFELREYDPIVGRWTTIDPAGQYWSPYVGMGNNAIGTIDPDGGEGGPAISKRPAEFKYDRALMSLYGINLTEVTISPPAPSSWSKFWDFIGWNQFSFNSVGIMFWGSGDFATNEMGQRDPSGKKIYHVDYDDLSYLSLGKDFKIPGGSRYDPNQRKNVNPPPGQQVFENFGELDKTAGAIYDQVDYMNKMRKRRAELIQHVRDSMSRAPYYRLGVLKSFLGDSTGIFLQGPNNSYKEYHFKNLKP
jgi:RHS repeat-associated protein